MQACIRATDPSQIGDARRTAVRLADELGYSETRKAEVAIVTTELATNLVRYGRDGCLLVQALSLASGPCIDLLAIDSGPGMTDIHRCLIDGFSSGGTAGQGLGAIRRLSDDFDAYSNPGEGTVIVSRIARTAPEGASTDLPLGVVSQPAPGESVCGDVWRVFHDGPRMAVMVADGLGHGPFAADAAEKAGALFDREPFDDPQTWFTRAHLDLTGSRGAAIACARLDVSRTLRYAGVGNIAGCLVSSEKSRGLPSQNGTVGVQMRKTMQSSDYEWPVQGFLVMHSDGLTQRWNLGSYAGLAVRHPAVVAGVLYRDFVRGRDDVTVVVVGVPPAARAS